MQREVVELGELRTFLVVSRELNVEAAAQILGLTELEVLADVCTLTDKVGGVLLQIDSSKVSLTLLGLLLRQATEHPLRSLQRAIDEVLRSAHR